MTADARRSLCLTLIHNRNERHAAARKTIEQLCMGLSNNWTAEIKEISWQPPVHPHSKPKSLYRAYLYRTLAAQWAQYKGLPPRERSQLIAHWKAAKDLLRYAFNPGKWAKWQLVSAIEAVLADKHIRAWQLFIESEFEFLLVMEDDATLKLDTIENFYSALESINSRISSGEFLYIDIAGGCKLSELKIDHLKIKSDIKNFSRYTKHVTNTTCCYIISRSLAALFLKTLIDRPHLRQIGSDWMINSLFVTTEDEWSSKCLCLHAEPPIMDHGSVTGQFLSSLRH